MALAQLCRIQHRGCRAPEAKLPSQTLLSTFFHGATAGPSTDPSPCAAPGRRLSSAVVSPCATAVHTLRLHPQPNGFLQTYTGRFAAERADAWKPFQTWIPKQWLLQGAPYADSSRTCCATPAPPPAFPTRLPFFWFSPLIWVEQHKRSNFAPHPLSILPPPLSGRSVLLLRHLRLWLSGSRRMTGKNQMPCTDKLQGHYVEAAVPYERGVFVPRHDFPCGIVWFQHLGVTVNVSHIFC